MDVPLWLTVACTLFAALLIPVNWRQYGPANFLWFSDIAFFLTVVALWSESRLLASMATLAVLIPEVAWNLDFLLGLVSGKSPLGLSVYMFDSRISRAIRSVSLFHVWLPILLIWMLSHSGYEPSALGWQPLAALLIVPLSYLCSDPKANINWVYGFGGKPQTVLPQALFVGLMTVAFPVLLYLPTHILLRKLFPPPHQ